MTRPDRLFAKKQTRVVDFVFDREVAAVFPDMIRRSVPGYENAVALLGLVAAHYWRPHTRVYDLGCSLGAATLSIHSRLGDAPHYICVDNAEAMIEKCRTQLAQKIKRGQVTFICEDAERVEMREAGVVVLNFVLQFIPSRRRDALLQRIYRALRPGGVVILAEKVRQKESSELEALHAAFKAANGYSELEISQKRAALENVMQIDSERMHLARLRRAGFARRERWLQSFNFNAYLAVK